MKKQFFLFILFTTVIAQAQIQDNWLGNYKGDLTSINNAGKKMTYAMEIIFAKETDSTWQWTIVYGEGNKRQERPYKLILKPNGMYEIDEQNSIVLSNALIGNRFISVFEVQGNLIHVTYTFKSKKIYFELISSSNMCETGGEVTENKDTIPFVNSYVIVAYQHAIFKRVQK